MTVDKEIPRINQTKLENKSPFSTYIWTISFLRPYRKQIVLYVLFSLVVIGVEMSVPKFIQFFIDKIIPIQAFNLLIYLIGVLAGLLVIMFACSIICNRLQLIISEQAARDLQYSMFDKLRALGFSYYERHPTGETLSLFNTEVSAVQQIYHRYFPRLVTNGVMVIVATCFMVTINISLSLIIIPCFLSYYLIGPYFEKKLLNTLEKHK